MRMKSLWDAGMQVASTALLVLALDAIWRGNYQKATLYIVIVMAADVRTMRHRRDGRGREGIDAE